MDYKEKYEQALERARQFSEKPYLEDSAGIVEYIFPELKENEDENKFWVAVEALEDAGKFEIADWLKALKYRVFPQPRKEWSDKDIEMINWLIRCCEEEHEELCNDRYGHQEIVSDLKRDCRKKWDWLESLKNKVVPQSQWKPSKEQIDALDFAIDCIVWEEFCVKRKVLKGLLEQLKKFKI